MLSRTDLAQIQPSPLAGEGGSAVRPGRVRGAATNSPLIQLRLAGRPARLRILLPTGEKEEHLQGIASFAHKGRRESASKASRPSHARGEGSFLNRRFDNLQNAVEVFEHLMVPEADKSESLCLQPGGARGISFECVLSAVQLDNQPRLGAQEIRDIAAERNLTAKLRPGQLPVAQGLPEPGFGIGLVAAQGSGARCMDVTICGHEPLTPMLAHRPSPARGEGDKARVI